MVLYVYLSMPVISDVHTAWDCSTFSRVSSQTYDVNFYLGIKWKYVMNICVYSSLILYMILLCTLGDYLDHETRFFVMCSPT